MEEIPKQPLDHILSVIDLLEQKEKAGAEFYVKIELSYFSNKLPSLIDIIKYPFTSEDLTQFNAILNKKANRLPNFSYSCNLNEVKLFLQLTQSLTLDKGRLFKIAGGDTDWHNLQLSKIIINNFKDAFELIITEYDFELHFKDKITDPELLSEVLKYKSKVSVS